jgi:hypothetical protein
MYLWPNCIFQIPSSNSLLDITSNQIKISDGRILILIPPQKSIYEVRYFSKILYHASSGTYTKTCWRRYHTQARTFAMSSLVIVGNYKVRRWGDLLWNNVHTVSRKNRSTHLEFERVNTKTHTVWRFHIPTFFPEKKVGYKYLFARITICITKSVYAHYEGTSLWYCQVFGSVTIDGVWVGYSIYWPLLYIIRNYTLQFNYTHRLVSSFYYSLP